MAIESAGSGCSVVVASGATVLAAESDAVMHGQAERLLPMVEAVMRRVGLPAHSLDIIGATVGPGSFTGIRVGLAAARGIAFAIHAQLIGVTSFEAVAAGFEGPPDHTGFILIALESRRDELYVQLFDHAHVSLGNPTAIMPVALDGMLNDLIGATQLLVAGDAAQRAASILAQRPDTIVAEGSAPDAVGVFRAVRQRWPMCARSAKPPALYLRAPDVTFPAARRQAGR